MGHEEKTIRITQELEHVGNASYTVKMTVEHSDDIEVIEFNYERSNGIYPLYNSLINTIRGIEGVHIELETCNPKFTYEITGSPNRNSTLLRILKETMETQGVTIDAYTK